MGFRTRIFGAVLGLVLAAGCSAEKGGTILAPPALNVPAPSVEFNPLSLVTGTWTGTQTATVGQSGAISVIFTQIPSPDASVSGTIAATLPGGTFHGTFTGVLTAIVVTATDGPAGACTYTANGTLNPAGTQITGTYVGSGAGNCPQKAGTFVLNGQSFVPPPALNCVDQFWQMNQGGNNDNAKINACQNRGGTWRGDNYDIPVDAVSTLYNDICEFTPNPPGSPGQDMTLIFEKAIACPVAPASR